MDPYEPPGEVIFIAEVGSTLHGTGVEGQDDRDEMAVVVESPEFVTGLGRWDSHVWRTQPEGERSGPGDIDLVYYGVRKFLGLAINGNPSILVAIFAPPAKVVLETRLGRSMQILAPSIVSRQAIPRFRGYMRSQALRLVGERGMGRGARTGARPELVEEYGWDTKFGMHMVRLGLQGRELALTGRITLPMPSDDLALCRAIRTGAYSADEALQIAFDLDAQLADLEHNSSLPSAADVETVEAWLHEAYLTTWAGR
ncbi:MAG: DNA polymerase beta superfamily protein [Actinomycetota bacterium]